MFSGGIERVNPAISSKRRAENRIISHTRRCASRCGPSVDHQAMYHSRCNSRSKTRTNSIGRLSSGSFPNQREAVIGSILRLMYKDFPTQIGASRFYRGLTMGSVSNSGGRGDCGRYGRGHWIWSRRVCRILASGTAIPKRVTSGVNWRGGRRVVEEEFFVTLTTTMAMVSTVSCTGSSALHCGGIAVKGIVSKACVASRKGEFGVIRRAYANGVASCGEIFAVYSILGDNKTRGRCSMELGLVLRILRGSTERHSSVRGVRACVGSPLHMKGT